MSLAADLEETEQRLLRELRDMRRTQRRQSAKGIGRSAKRLRLMLRAPTLSKKAKVI